MKYVRPFEMPESIPPIVCNFYRHFIIDDGDKCWNWQGSVRGYNHYGECTAHRPGTPRFIREAAHRLSYKIHYGNIPTNMDVCHKCDNPRCVNPGHLFLGSRKDNMQDCLKKGRFIIGSKHKHAKLTEDVVREARLLKIEGTTYDVLEKKYNVNRMTLHAAITGKTWRHVK